MNSINDSDLSTFVVKVLYNDIVCKRDQVCLRTSKYRYCCGNVDSQLKLYRQRNSDLCNYKSMPLEKHACDRTVNSILEGFNQGLTLELNLKKMEVLANRFCMSGVFYCAHDPITLDREKPIVVMDLYDSLSKLFQKLERPDYDRQNILSSLTSELVVGTRPHKKKSISIRLRPLIAEKIASFFSKKAQGLNMASINADVPSIEIDLPNSIDEQLKRLDISKSNYRTEGY